MRHQGFPAARWLALSCILTLALTAAAALAAASQQGRVLYSPAAKPAGDWGLLAPVGYENVSLFPVTGPAGDTSDFVTLDEALASGEVMVAERGSEILRRTRDARPLPAPQGAAVNELVLVHRGRKPLVLLAGEVITGGKQDRVIAKDRIVPPGADPVPLDVFCVERGRWSAGAQFTASKLMAHPSVRERAAVDQQQSQVWDAVRSGSTARATGGAAASAPALTAESVAETVRTEAGTESYARIYGSARVQQPVESFAAELERRWSRAVTAARAPVIGVVVAYNGEVAWADVFASAQLFERYWPKLVRSYTVEALARPATKEQASMEDARGFLRPAQGREVVESEPGVYRWRQVTEGRYAEIALEALSPRRVVLHWVKIQRTS